MVRLLWYLFDVTAWGVLCLAAWQLQGTPKKLFKGFFNFNVELPKFEF